MARLGDIFTITSGGTPEKRQSSYYKNGTIPWVKTGDLKEKFVTHDVEYITEDGLNNSSAKIFPAGTVLVAMYGATIGACSILNYEASTNQACAAFLPTSDVLPNYLYYFLSSKKESFIQDGVGGAQPNISAGYLKRVPFDIRPLSEQRHIADVLDKVDEIISQRQKQFSKLDELVKVRFVEMFGDMLLNPLPWPERRLETMADIVSGITKGRKTQSTDLFEVPYMAVSNVKDGYIDWTTVKTIMATQSEIDQYRLLPNDVLMTEGGDPDKLGRGAIIREPQENCIHQNHIFRVRLNKSAILPEFFAEYLQHQKAKRYFLRCAKQTTGIASINMKQLRALPVSVPPIDNQEGFADFVREVARQKLTIQQSLDKLEVLKKSLMQDYFG